MFVRLTLFAAKVLSLSAVCWPYSAAWWVVAVVVGLAAGDLQWAAHGHGHGPGHAEDERGDGERSGPMTGSRSGSGSANGVGFGTIGTGLVANNTERAGLSPPSLGLGLVGAAQQGEAEQGHTHIGERERRTAWLKWPRGWERTIWLLLLHCLVVVTAERSGAMCARRDTGKTWDGP